MKIIFWLILWGFSWGLVIFSSLPGVMKFVIAVIHMLTHIFITLNIGHDANHNAITEHRFFSQLLKRSFDLVGFSSFCWRTNHNRLHHHYTSVYGKDPTINGRGIMRFDKAETKLPFHQYQHIYAPVIYGLVTLNYVFVKDFSDFRKFYAEGMSIKKLLPAFIEAVLFKVFYLTYTLLIPMLVLPFHPLIILGTFLFSHFLMGQLIILIQVPHFNLRTRPVTPEEVSSDWNANLDFILKHTSDLAPRSKFLSWILGGVNTHTIHHVLPRSCHTHYPRLTEELMKYCVKENRPYSHYESAWDGYLSHYAYLKKLGRIE